MQKLNSTNYFGSGNSRRNFLEAISGEDILENSKAKGI